MPGCAPGADMWACRARSKSPLLQLAEEHALLAVPLSTCALLLRRVSLGPKDTICAGLAFRAQRAFRRCEKIDFLPASLVALVLLHPMRPIPCSDTCAA